MTCPQETPWSWCLDKKCTVNPTDSTKAVCVCTIMDQGPWVTLGGNCDTSTCQTGYWSGTTVEAYKEGVKYLTQELNLDPSIPKDCPQ